jgi:hypothetical protein
MLWRHSAVQFLFFTCNTTTHHFETNWFFKYFVISESLVVSRIAVKFSSNTNHERVGNVLHSFGKIELSWYEIPKMNRYLENVLYRVVVGNLKIPNNPTVLQSINSDELLCDSGHGWKQLTYSLLQSSKKRKKSCKQFL